ncbi:MAG: tetratricopeptide repeat protein [Paludibacteraceae bacterium]|nr:tetratricopeptide repeat protein [Paludibacteraceae bacterium]
MGQRLQVDGLIREHRYSEALQLTTIQLRAHPRNGQLYAQRAWLYRQMGQPGMAILDIDEALKHLSSSDLTRSQLLYMRGEIHTEVGMYIDAYDDFTQAIEQDPHCAPCYAHRGDVNMTMEYYPLAVDDYAEALRLESYNSEYRVEYARAMLSNGQLEEAAAQLQQVLADDPGMLEAKRLLATYHYLQDEVTVYIDLYLSYLQEYYEQHHLPSEADHLLYAIQDSVSYRYLSDALNQRINHTDGDIQVMFRYIRAYVRSLNKDYAGANSDLSQLIQNEQDYDHSALEMRAYNYMQTEQYQSALTDYSRLIALSPRNTRAYYGRSLAHRGLFEIDEAISDLLSLTRLDYNEAPNAFYQAARLEVEREHYIQAIRYLSRAIELAPENAYLYRYRAEQYEALGNSRMAELDYQAADLLQE